ncbi:MAG: hypothetical protein ACLGHL_10855, partial [Actinomycetota bacterium]
VAMAAQTARDEARTMARDRQRFLESDPEMMARSREMSSHWEDRIARVLAERDGASEPSPDHRLASFVGIAVARAVGFEWPKRSDSISAEDLIREHFSALRNQLS